MQSRLSRFCDGIMEAAWLAALILIPVFFNVYSSRIFEPDKITLLRSLALLTLGAWLVKLIENGGVQWTLSDLRDEKTKWKYLLKYPLLAPVSGLVVIYLIATLFSVTPRVSLWGSYQRLQGTYTTLSYIVIFAGMLANLRKKTQVDRLLTAIVITSLPISLYGILQRYQLDPIPWGGDVTRRIAANMGNSIFVAAYLIMVFPVTAGKIVESFSAILKEQNRLWAHVARGSAFVFIAALQLIAIYMSGSRGPALGWMAGSYFLALLLSLHWRKRWMTYMIVGVAVVGAIFLVVFNIPNGPLENLRKSQAVGRFGSLLDTDSNTAKVRQYIWEGAVELVAPHPPLEYPDGNKDPFNLLRLFIGYGPESMYVAYNSFYPPELGHVERRNASPDRSHNETWDSLVITGVLGFLVYLAVFLSVFYYGLKWLGLVQTGRQRTLFWTLASAGGLAGAAALILWGGWAYMGVGLPFGLAMGLLIYLGLVAVSSRSEASGSSASSSQALVLIMLLSAVVAHFIEINFGIAIVATRTYFWAYAALILLVGIILPKHNEYRVLSPAQVVAAEEESSRSKRKGAHSGKRRKIEAQTRNSFFANAWVRPAIIGSAIMTFLLAALGYDYVSNQGRATTTMQILKNSLIWLPNEERTAYGILALILTTWLIGALLLASENEKAEKVSEWLQSFGLTLAGSALGGMVYWFWQAGRLASLAGFVPTTPQELMEQIGRIGGLLTSFYVFILLLILLLSVYLCVEKPTRTGWGLGTIFSPFILVGVIIIVNYTNLRVIHADIAFKMAEPFASGDQWPVATLVYNHAIELAPNEDYYYLFLGRSYLEQAKTVQTETDEQALVYQAEQDLKQAQRINPLNTDHTANLARLYTWWAAQSTDSTVRNDRGETANRYYARALTLSPQNSTLWGEWAILLLDLLNQPDQAYQKLSRAIGLDAQYNFTQGLMGDYFARQARASQDAAERREAYQQAAFHYQEAVKWSKSTEASAIISYLVSLGNVYIEHATLENIQDPNPELLRSAIDAFERAVEVGPRAQDLYRMEEQIARLYIQLGEKENAVSHAQKALTAAPDEEEKVRLETLIGQILAQQP